VVRRQERDCLLEPVTLFLGEVREEGQEVSFIATASGCEPPSPAALGASRCGDSGSTRRWSRLNPRQHHLPVTVQT